MSARSWPRLPTPGARIALSDRYRSILLAMGTVSLAQARCQACGDAYSETHT